MASPLSVALTPQAVSPAVRKHFVDAYEQLKPKLEYAFKVDASQTDYNEIEQNYTGLGTMSPIAEGQIFPEDDVIQGYSATYTPVKYGKTIPITFEMFQWKKTNDIVNVAQQGGKAMARHQEKVGSAVYNNGFNGAFTSLSDAKPLFSTAHPRADGGAAQSNASANGLVLSEANLETAILASEEILDDRGEQVQVFVSCLLVPPALRKEALAITKSILKPDSTNVNNINVYNPENANMAVYGGGTIADVVVWHNLGAYLGGSDTAWYLLDRSNLFVTWKWAYKPMISEKNDITGFRNDVTYFKARYGASTGWTNWRAVWGSKGDGAPYAG